LRRSRRVRRRGRMLGEAGFGDDEGRMVGFTWLVTTFLMVWLGFM
jgi:hypothetical protein